MTRLGSEKKRHLIVFEGLRAGYFRCPRDARRETRFSTGSTRFLLFPALTGFNRRRANLDNHDRRRDAITYQLR